MLATTELAAVRYGERLQECVIYSNGMNMNVNINMNNQYLICYILLEKKEMIDIP